MSRVLQFLVIALSVGASQGLEVERINVKDYLRGAPQLKEWTCDAQEDADLVLRHNSTVRESRTLGFVMLAIGEKSLNESYHTVQCLHEAFDEAGQNVGVQVFEGSLADVGCTVDTPAMYGTLEAQRCFIQIQRVKFLLDRSAPFDIVMVIDTDMWAYPSPHSKDLIPKIFSKFSVWTSVDLMLTIVPQFMTTREIGTLHDSFRWLNSGMLLFRKSDATDRFFACAMQKMNQAEDDNAAAVRAGTRNHLPHDQDIINNMIDSGPFLSVGLKTLGEDWQCRGIGNPADITENNFCVFVHRHLTAGKSDHATCPFPYATWEERP
mmetsp:Transcript_13195/g.39895  ORF Transcript_13195/g.39895 Transcript_13195/m.39895 type:complete len:322 (+) Transcript_13195:104-1069(+)|eukprot:CAMPEP_0198649486 /NCGR_PEP_ID=MMETSP1467-20131203/4303_1 /TAXON_ID=1462469 /ORGANISM="unid. sp., Strain CCMP2135" /LENGTH=321 /DNA_ID=CAMNT_0044385279 /DNA_START=82 /DNA_END=1047 /DNA_ORIENTATION=-